MQKVIVYVYFKLNQEYIENTYCINKKKVELQCHGKCHLKKMIKETTDKKDSTIPSFIKEIKLLKVEVLNFEATNNLFLIKKKGNFNSLPLLYELDFFPNLLKPPIT